MADDQQLQISDTTDELIAERRTGDVTQLPDDMPSWMAFLIRWIDTLNLWIGRIVCFLTLPLFAVMVYEVFVRYVFVAPTSWAYDLSRMLAGSLFMLGAAYALSKGIHIRADFLYRNFSVRNQGRVDATLYLLFYMPGMLVFMWTSIDFAFGSWLQMERGMDSAWMPYLAPVKSALPVGIFFLILQGVSEFFKSYYAATRGRWPV